MMTRSTEATLTFRHSFALASMKERLPAGIYKFVVDEEAVPGLSFLAFRRTRTLLRTPVNAYVVDANELAAAFETDRIGSADMGKRNMKYLGRISGGGQLLRNGEEIARASFDFEGFIGPRGVDRCSGEIELAPDAHPADFETRGVQLRTDDGRLLNLAFRDKVLRWLDDRAEVDVTGDLPATPAEWRAMATA